MKLSTKTLPLIALLLLLGACSAKDPLNSSMSQCHDFVSGERKAISGPANQRCEQARSEEETFQGATSGIRN